MSKILEEMTVADKGFRDFFDYLAERVTFCGGFTVRAECRESWGGEHYGYWAWEPRSGYAVAIGKQYEHVTNGIKSAERLLEDIACYFGGFRQRAWDMGCYIGCWLDDGKLYFDIVKVVTTPAEALALAKANSQLAYYDIEKGESVYV